VGLSALWLAGQEKKKKESLMCLGPSPQSGLDKYKWWLKSRKYLVEIIKTTGYLHSWEIAYVRGGEGESSDGR
jgi:hypothetical protein